MVYQLRKDCFAQDNTQECQTLTKIVLNQWQQNAVASLTI